MRTKLLISINLFVVALHTIGAAPLPHVTFVTGTSGVSVPQEALIGEDFTFTVTFSNTGSIGYGPFIDLVFNAGGANMTKPPTCSCDGITFVSAKIVGVNGGPVSFATFPVSANCNPTPTTVPLTHPFASNGVLPVTVPAGGQLVTIQLPFGSYDHTQPPIAVEVTAHVSNFADEGIPLTIWARGGFQYGADALNNPGSDPPRLSDTNPISSAWTTHAPTTPRVMIIKKECSAPENETATGPNFPQKYTIKVDIADGQSIANLKVQDILPNNVQYVGNVAVTINNRPPPPVTQGSTCTGADYTLTQQPSTTNPGGTLEVSFCNPIAGSPNPPDDVTVTFTFYIPENDANGHPVLQSCTTPALSINKIHAEGDWTPLDPCDTSPPPPLHVTSTVNAAHKLYDKCIAVQKKVTVAIDTGATGPTPGDTLKYVINFQVSDYKTIDKIKITDLLTDGQTVVNIPAPPMLTTIGDQFPNSPYTNLVFGSLLTTTPDPNMYCPPVSGGVHGGTRLVFDVSGALMAAAGSTGNPRHQLGILTGGWAALSSSTTPATGQIVFYAKIQDQFSLPHPPGDKFVDKDDPLNDCIHYFTARVCTNVPASQKPQGTSGTAQDDSMTATAIVTDSIKKTVYAVKRGTSVVCGPSPNTACSNFPNPPQEVHPGDEVTFRIEKTIPSGDAEHLTVQDFLPKPVFDVNDPDANGIANSWNGPPIPVCSAPPPSPGNACRFTPASGGTDTLGAPFLTGFPIFIPTIATNSLLFSYGNNFNDPLNQPKTADLLFTSTVTYQPYADGLFLTNEAQECEKNTLNPNVMFCQTAVAQVNLREPNLRVRKGVIATNNPHGLFSQPGSSTITPPLATAQAPSGAIFNLTGFTGFIHSPLGPLIDSNLSNVDANDLVTFAIVIENQGGYPAFDVNLTDTIPSCLTNVTAIIVKDGTGGLLPSASFTITPSANNFTFSLNSTASIPAYATNGTNIIVITFQAQIVSKVLPGCCDNVAKLTHYASEHNGPDFVSAGFTPPFQDSATICVNPTLTKSVVATSEAHTTPQISTTPQTPANTPQVAIGEIVRYRLLVQLPEGGPLLNFNVTDTLPAGMKFMNDGTARLAFVSNTNGSFNITHPGVLGTGFDFIGNETTLPFLGSLPAVPAGNITGGATCGAPVIFKLGTIQNNDNDIDLEFVVIEFNALVCNVAGNTNGTTLPNTFSVSVNGNPTSNTMNVVVVEPNLDVHKTYTPPNPTSPGYFTVTLTNTGTADAFDTHLTDSLPSGLTFSTSPAPTVAVSPAGCAIPSAPIVSGNTITVDVPRIPASSGCTITLKFWVQGQFCGTNTAQASYSSLPGGVNSHPALPVGTQPNSTGSITPCQMSNQEDCERIYNASGQASNNCTPSCTPPPQGMVAWWPLDEQNGALAVNDLALLNNQGTPNPGALGSLNAPNPVAGQVGGALDFSPSALNYVNVPDQAEIRFGTGNLSIDAWVKPAVVLAANKVQPIVDKVSNNVGYALYLQGTHLHFSIGGSSFVTYIGTPVIAANQWTHVAVTVARPNTVTLYINGVAASWTTSVSLPAGSTDNLASLWIGGSRLPLGRDEIAIDELEFFNRDLTSGEVLGIFNAGASGKCKCSVATSELITCNSNGTFKYVVSLTNLSNSTVSTVSFSPIGSVTITPNSIPISPLPPGGSTTVTVTISGSGAVSGANVCFIVGLTGPPPAGCRAQHCIILPSCQTACAPQPPKMVSWWRLDETSGNTVVDSKGTQHNGTTSGSIGSDPAVTSPEVAGALLFTNSNASVPGGAYNFGTGNFSVDAWVKGASHPTTVLGIVDKLDASSSPKGFAFFVGANNGKVQFTMGNGTSSPATFMSSTIPFMYNSWQHVAVTVQRIGGGSPTGTFYINGAQAGTFVPPANTINNLVPLLIGSHHLNPNTCQSCQVALDEVEIFNDVVSPTDIQAIFNAGSAGKCP